MLRSSNPVLSRKDAFTPGQPAGYGQQGVYPGQSYGAYGGPQGQQYAHYSDQRYAQYNIQDPQAAPAAQGAPDSGGRMTLDDVLTKTAVLMGLMILTAAAAWWLVPASLVTPALVGSAVVGLVLSFVVAIRRIISPVLTGVFAVVEGVFVGMISMLFETIYPGIVASAVFATLVAAAVTLAAYKFLNVRVRGLVAKVAVVGTIAFAVAMLANFGLSFVGINLGLRAGLTGEVGWLPILVSGIAVVLAVLNLFLDFQHVENGIRMGAPARESWRAAFGLLVTMVWLYVELLRIISYFRR